MSFCYIFIMQAHTYTTSIFKLEMLYTIKFYNNLREWKVLCDKYLVSICFGVFLFFCFFNNKCSHEMFLLYGLALSNDIKYKRKCDFMSGL